MNIWKPHHKILLFDFRNEVEWERTREWGRKEIGKMEKEKRKITNNICSVSSHTPTAILLSTHGGGWGAHSSISRNDFLIHLLLMLFFTFYFLTNNGEGRRRNLRPSEAPKIFFWNWKWLRNAIESYRATCSRWAHCNAIGTEQKKIIYEILIKPWGQF